LKGLKELVTFSEVVAYAIYHVESLECGGFAVDYFC
jgi:hypothetical protein